MRAANTLKVPGFQIATSNVDEGSADLAPKPSGEQGAERCDTVGGDGGVMAAD